MRAYIEKHWIKGGRFAPKVNWLGIRDVAEGKLHSALEDGRAEDAKEWAKIRLLILEGSARDWNSARRREFAFEKMNIVAGLIYSIGPIEGDPLLDPRVAEDIFFESVGLSFEETKHVVMEYHQAQEDESSEEIVERDEHMEYLKERIQILKGLLERDQIVRTDEVKQWCGLLQYLA